MSILATVDFGKQQITQSWKFMEGNPSPYIEVLGLEDGRSIMIKLEIFNDNYSSPSATIKNHH